MSRLPGLHAMQVIDQGEMRLRAYISMSQGIST